MVARYTCPVCGFRELNEPTHFANGSPTYEICPCCGFEFGYDDETEGLTFEDARQAWVDGGMQWWSKAARPPADWQPTAQLAILLGKNN